MDRTPIGNDDTKSTFTSESALSGAEKRSNVPCAHCGVVVSVASASRAALDKVLCVDCRSKFRPEPSLAAEDSDDSPVPLTGETILTVICRVCQSSLLVSESKAGTQIKCPDCHSMNLVQQPSGMPNRETKKRQSRSKQKPFDPDAELSLEEPVERPRVAPLPDLDDIADDLLSAPLPEVEPSQLDDSESDRSQEDADLTSASQSVTRRQRYERVQKRVISEDRKKKRKQALAQRGKRKNKPENIESDSHENRPRKKRRRKKRTRKGKRDSLAWFRSAFDCFRQPSIIVGWIVSASCLGGVYSATSDWSPLAWLDRWYVMLSQSPVVFDIRLILNLLLFVFGSLCLYFSCGKNLALNAFKKESASERDDEQVSASGFFVTLQFAFAWLLAGLPFLYWSILFLPFQLLIVPPLLVGSWHNRSIWKFVLPQGLFGSHEVAPEVDAEQASNRRLWFSLYRSMFVATVLATGPVMLIRLGGAWAFVGWLLMIAIMIGSAGVIGRHCRDLSKSLETPL